MSRILLYTTPYCGYCRAAKRLLDQKGHAYIEIDVSEDPAMRQEMASRAMGGRTVPQIFIDGTHVGGFEELAELDRAGKLDPWLAQPPVHSQAQTVLAEIDTSAGDEQ
jgi:glutaredoxin 3